MYIDIPQENYLLLNKSKITLTCVYLLEQLIEGIDISNLDDISSLGAIGTLQRKGYLDTKLNITDAGNRLYLSLQNKIEVIKKVKIQNNKFEDWWKVYPQSDEFEYKGKHFKGTQKKNIKKEECLILFNKWIHSGIDANKIISATEYHINNAKSLSLRKNTNQLSFIPNSERYLREKCFEPFLNKTEIKEIKKDFEI